MIPVGIPREDVPEGFSPMVWKGGSPGVADADAIRHDYTGSSVFRLELDEQERAALAAGFSLYLVVAGPVAPFALTPSFDGAVKLAAGEA